MLNLTMLTFDIVEYSTLLTFDKVDFVDLSWHISNYNQLVTICHNFLASLHLKVSYLEIPSYNFQMSNIQLKTVNNNTVFMWIGMNVAVNLYKPVLNDSLWQVKKDTRHLKTGWVDFSASTQIAQGSYFQIFMRWVKQNGGKFSEYTPDQLIEYQKQTSNGSQYDILDVLAQPYVRQAEGTFNTKRVRYSNIRSFFAHNRAELPKDPNFKIRPDRQPIYGELLPDEIKKNILASNKAYQAAFMVMFQSAMDQEMFSYWNMNGYDNLMAQLNSHDLIIKIELPGRKANKNIKPFYSFLEKMVLTRWETG